MRLPVGVFTTLIVSSVLTAIAAPTAVQVKGSDTIGGKLGQDFARGYMAAHPGSEVKWEALGSGTAFVGLLDGTAQLGASSRPVQQTEIKNAAERGIELREFVIGYDGIAIIVHPRNSLTNISVTQAAAIFTGATKNWRELGGPDLPIHVLSRPSYSGTFSFFRDKVLRRGNDKGSEDYATGTEFVEENGAILTKVAQDPTAISYVGIGWLRPEVKALGIVPQPGQPPIVPSVAAVRTGSYPIYRPLLLYSPGEPHGPVRDLLAFILSRDGQLLVAKNDFVPLDAPQALPAETTLAPATSGVPRADSARPATIRVNFLRGADLTAAAKTALSELATQIQSTTDRLEVVGHADARGDRTLNAKLSLARAKVVAQFLVERGVAESRIDLAGRGAEDPVGTNTTARGRGANRRVDVTVLSPTASGRH